MTSLTAFDAVSAKTLAAEIRAALADIGAKHGISLTPGPLRYDAHQFTVKVTGKINIAAGADEGISNAAQNHLNRQMAMYGIASDTNAKGDRLIAFNSGSPKYRFTYVSKGGTRYKTTSEGARARFGQTKEYANRGNGYRIDRVA